MVEKEKIWNFIKEYWEFVKKCYPLPRKDEIDKWDAIVTEEEELFKKWNDRGKFGEFVKKVIVAWLEYIGEVNT